jgi:hypothetical protein
LLRPDHCWETSSLWLLRERVSERCVGPLCSDPALSQKTHYNDANRLSVVDSDMPEILLWLGLWKPGDPLPIPVVKPDNSTKLSIIKGEELCQ